MVNPYAGLIDADFKTTYDNAMDALLQDDALTVPCRMEFGVTKNTPCTNCLPDTIGRQSSNIYRQGGPSPFVNGTMCPTCNGIGFIPDVQSESFNMAVVWNDARSKFIDLGIKLDSGKAYAQTICHSDRYISISKAKTAVLNTNLEPFGRQRYERVGDPTPYTFGYKTYIVTTWNRI